MSAYQKNLEYNYHSWEASDDLSSYQFHPMTLSGGQLALAVDTDVVVGILQDKPDTAGLMGLVAMGGFSKAVLDGSGTPITALCKLAPAATTGHLVITTTDGDDYCAIALEGCTADGDIMTVFVIPFGEVSTGA